MLFQVIEGREVPVAFWSKAFTATERRWSTYEQKTFALVASVVHWESLLLGHQFSVEIDHKNMLWMYKSDTPKVVRWRLRLAPFDFDINHIPGNTNLVADALSRLHPLTVPAEPQLVPGPSVSAMDRVRKSTSTWSLSRRWVSFTIMSGGMHTARSSWIA